MAMVAGFHLCMHKVKITGQCRRDTLEDGRLGGGATKY